MIGTKSFDDLATFAFHLAASEIALQSQLASGMKKALKVLEDDAKQQIGHYQGEAGDFPAWTPLATATEAEKVRIGAPSDAPLLRHGGLYASIGHTLASANEGVVGSTDPTMIYHEFGTRNMPPRPVFGPAMVKNMQKVQEILGGAVVAGIVGGEVLASGGYFGEPVKP